MAGCASPGSPRPPSLHLPEPVRDLSAVRSGDTVQLQFTLPRRTTDGQSLAGAEVHASVCRQETVTGPCKPVAIPGSTELLRVPEGVAQDDRVLWTDPLPPELANGAPRPLVYRVSLRNAEGRSAGNSDPVYTAAGAAPFPVAHFTAQGSRLGVLLQWQADPGPGEVLLQRTEVDAKPAVPARAAAAAPVSKRTRSLPSAGSPRKQAATEPGTVWLQADAATRGAGGETIDNTIAEGVRYRYTAVRQITAKAGGRSLQLRSAVSEPVDIAWRDVYPPPAPQRLTALGYATGDTAAGGASPQKPQGYAVDLIWEPVNDPRVTGYLVTRQALSPAGESVGAPQRLEPSPVKTPGFHDAGADPAVSYRYVVVAVDARGNMSAPATAVVSASLRPGAPAK